MWSVNAEEMLENEAWKPGRVTSVLFARRLPLGKGGERGLEGSCVLSQSSKWNWPQFPGLGNGLIRRVLVPSPGCEGQLRYYIKKTREEVTSEKAKEGRPTQKKDWKEGNCNPVVF